MSAVTLPKERAGRPAPPSLAERRQGLAAGLAAGIWRTDPPAVEETLNGVRVLRFRPSSAKRATVLHFHGGGFRLGIPEMIAPFAAALAARCGVEVICPAYRLAPEHPFPAGLADAHAVMQSLRQARVPLFFSGDSAGGGLATGLTALAVAEGMPIAGLIALSPWLDLTVTSPTYDAHTATDPLFSRASAEEAADAYLQGISPRDPLASPLFGAVAGFPPTFLSVGAGEVLAGDARTFHDRLRAATVESELHPVAGMEHVAVTRDLALPGAAETFAAIVAFIARKC